MGRSIIQAKERTAYKPKPDKQMTCSGQRVQVDVKVVPRRCITDPELRLFQYTGIDEFTRLRFLAACPEQSTYYCRAVCSWGHPGGKRRRNEPPYRLSRTLSGPNWPI